MSKTKLITAFCLVGTGVAAALTAPRAAQEMPTPTEQHERIAESVGDWTGTIKMWMDPTSEPMETACSEKNTMLGGFWLLSNFESDMGGMPFKGHYQLGYDSSKGKYVGTWIDSMNPMLTVMEGTIDDATGVQRMEWKAPDMMTGRMAKHWSEETLKDGIRTSVFYMEAEDGSAVKSMEIRMKKMSIGKPAEAGTGGR